MIGTLVKSTANKKLMIKISESAYNSITTRLTAECKKKNFPTDRLATFSLENDDGETNYFVMISLDKYDKQNMRKFEQMLMKDINFSTRIKSYDFIPDGKSHGFFCGETEQRCGINLELISIRQYKPEVSRDELEEIKHSMAEARREEAKCEAIEDRDVREMITRIVSDKEQHGHVTTETLAAAEKMMSDMPSRATRGLDLLLTRNDLPPAAPRCRRFTTATEQELSDVDKIADKAAARACSKEMELNAEERAIDEYVEKVVGRRRRTVKEASLTALEAQMKVLENRPVFPLDEQ